MGSWRRILALALLLPVTWDPEEPWPPLLQLFGRDSNGPSVLGAMGAVVAAPSLHPRRRRGAWLGWQAPARSGTHPHSLHAGGEAGTKLCGSHPKAALVGGGGWATWTRVPEVFAVGPASLDGGHEAMSSNRAVGEAPWALPPHPSRPPPASASPSYYPTEAGGDSGQPPPQAGGGRWTRPHPSPSQQRPQQCLPSGNTPTPPGDPYACP